LTVRFILKPCIFLIVVVNFVLFLLQKDEEVEFFRQKFAGSQADRKLKEEADAKLVAEQLKKTKLTGFEILYLNHFVISFIFLLLGNFLCGILVRTYLHILC
jgi:hypothetical protein